MPTSNASSGSQSRTLIVMAVLAVPIAIAALAGLLIVRTSADGSGELQSVAESVPTRSSTSDPMAVGEPDENGDRLPVERGAVETGAVETGPVESATPTEGVGGEVAPANNPLVVAYDELWELARQRIGGNDPVGTLASLTDQVGGFPVTGDAALASFGLDVERNVRDRALRIQYRAAVRYYTQMPVDEVVALYRSETPALDLPERESETGTDDDGDYIDVDFGDFGNHPDPLIWWANLSIQVRADESGTLVRIFYTIERTEVAEPSGLLAEIEAGLPLADGYENTSVRVSAFSSDPYAQPAVFRVDFTATATLAASVDSGAAELARLADIAAATGDWTIDEQTESGVWLDNVSDGDIRNYLTLWLTDDETVARYAYS